MSTEGKTTETTETAETTGTPTKDDPYAHTPWFEPCLKLQTTAETEAALGTPPELDGHVVPVRTGFEANGDIKVWQIPRRYLYYIPTKEYLATHKNMPSGGVTEFILPGTDIHAHTFINGISMLVFDDMVDSDSESETDDDGTVICQEVVLPVPTRLFAEFVNLLNHWQGRCPLPVTGKVVDTDMMEKFNPDGYCVSWWWDLKRRAHATDMEINTKQCLHVYTLSGDQRSERIETTLTNARLNCVGTATVPGHGQLVYLGDISEDTTTAACDALHEAGFMTSTASLMRGTISETSTLRKVSPDKRLGLTIVGDSFFVLPDANMEAVGTQLRETKTPEFTEEWPVIFAAMREYGEGDVRGTLEEAKISDYTVERARPTARWGLYTFPGYVLLSTPDDTREAVRDTLQSAGMFVKDADPIDNHPDMNPMRKPTGGRPTDEELDAYRVYDPETDDYVPPTYSMAYPEHPWPRLSDVWELAYDVGERFWCYDMMDVIVQGVKQMVWHLPPPHIAHILGAPRGYACPHLVKLEQEDGDEK